MAFRLDSLRAKAWMRGCFLAVVSIATFFLAAVAVQPAGAHPRAVLSTIVLVPEGDDFEAEISDEEFEEGDEWEGEEEEVEELEADDSRGLPPECVLSTATARVVASDKGNTVRLSIHYASSEPVRTTVDYWLKGGQGSLQLKASKRFMARRGHLSSTERLSDRAMEKVRAARVFIVHIDPVATPSYCDRYSTLRLTAKRTAGTQTSWSQPAADG